MEGRRLWIPFPSRVVRPKTPRGTETCLMLGRQLDQVVRPKTREGTKLASAVLR